MDKKFIFLSLILTTVFAEQNSTKISEGLGYLVEKCSEEKVYSLQEGKIQYKIIKEGKGSSVQPYNAPLVRSNGHFLSGDFFTLGCEEEIFNLDEILPALKEGILGMKEGELRVIYIHPELIPQTKEDAKLKELLIFEVEIIKADVSSEAHAASARFPIFSPSDLNAPPSHFQ